MTSVARTPIQTGALPIPDAKRSVVIIEPLRSVGKRRRHQRSPISSRTWAKLLELPEVAELALEVSGVVDNYILI
jgi:hypothetical protein